MAYPVDFGNPGVPNPPGKPNPPRYRPEAASQEPPPYQFFRQHRSVSQWPSSWTAICGKEKGLKSENASQSRHLTIEAAMQL
jgi:hypothetical protein